MDGDGGEGGWYLDGESRYGHSLTPEEPVILEENSDDYAPWPAGLYNFVLFYSREILILISILKSFVYSQ